MVPIPRVALVPTVIGIGTNTRVVFVATPDTDIGIGGIGIGREYSTHTRKIWTSHYGYG